MKIALLILVLLLIPFSNSSYSQSFDFNLKNLDNVTVQVIDDQALISNTIYQKIITEVKLKLMSSGMKVTSLDEATARMNIIIHAIKSNLAEHRILVIITVNENVTTKRLGAVQTNAVTYYDYSFFKNKIIEEAVYNKIMDEMIINFIEIYLSQQK